MLNSEYPPPRKRLGQVFLTNRSVAEAEAAHSYDKNVIEIGPGKGILTKELCLHAKRVIAVEKDTLLFDLLNAELQCDNLKLINKDFLDATDEEMDVANTDIVIANIPYNISSPIIEWLSRKNMEAVLCLQKEFVEHMMAKCNTHNYSKLSVISGLTFKIFTIMNVKSGNFYPIPKVDSVIIYLKPNGVKVAEKELRVINAVMQHKKKTVKNALLDSESYLEVEKSQILAMLPSITGTEKRVFKMQPEEIHELAKQVVKKLKLK